MLEGHPDGNPKQLFTQIIYRDIRDESIQSYTNVV